MTDQTLPPVPSESADAKKVRVWIDEIKIVGQDAPIRPTTNGVTAIVGANNSGKTTLLSELHMSLTQPTHYASEWFKPKVLVPEGVWVQTAGSQDDLLAWLDEHASWGTTESSPQIPAFHRQSGSLTMADVSQWGASPTQHAPFWTLNFSAEGYGQGFEAGRVNVDASATQPTQILYERPDLLRRLSSICLEVFGLPLTLDTESANHVLLVGKPEVDPPTGDDDKRPYRRALSRLDKMSAQGHGMRSWMSVIMQLITRAYPIIIADEPEVFLHPPQARALGHYIAELSSAGSSQVIIATHDRNILAGLLERDTDLSVVRLVRSPQRTTAHQLPASEVRELLSDPVLKYSNVLDGIFHQAVIIGEGYRDCTYYQAAIEYRAQTQQSATTDDSVEQAPVRLPDVMLLSAEGKQGMAKLAAALRAVKVPVVVVTDLDLLDPNDGTLEKLVKLFRGNWAELQPLHRGATQHLKGQPAEQPLAIVQAALHTRMDEIRAADPNASWDDDTRTRVLAVLKASETPSYVLKSKGVHYAKGQARGDLDRLLASLLEIGILPIHVGDLELFAPACSQRKDRWLSEALTAKAYQNSETQQEAARIMKAVGIAVSSASASAGASGQGRVVLADDPMR